MAGLLALERLDLGWCTGLADEQIPVLAHHTRLSELILSRTQAGPTADLPVCDRRLVGLAVPAEQPFGVSCAGQPAPACPALDVLGVGRVRAHAPCRSATEAFGLSEGWELYSGSASPAASI